MILSPCSKKNITWQNLFLIMVLFSLIFDYRRAEGDAFGFVVVFGLINIIAGLLFIFNKRIFNTSFIKISIPFFLFAISSSIVGLVRGQELYAVLAQILPILIFTNVFLVCASYANNSEDLLKLMQLMVISGLMAAVWKVFFAFSYYGLDMENVRYQILSGSTIILFVYGIASFIIKKSKYAMLSLFLSLGVVFISVTRTYILIFLIILLISSLCVPFKNYGVILYKGLLTLFLIVLSVVFLSTIQPSFEDRWVSRLFSDDAGGSDLTSLTRIAEINGQIEFLKNDIWGTMFGFGIAANTYWSGDELNQILAILGSNFDTVGKSYGHNTYVGIWYVGGLIFGLPIIIILLLTPLLGLIKLKKYYSNIEQNEKFVAFFSICSVFGFVFYGLLGGTFGDRSMSLYYGISMGLLIRFIYLKISKVERKIGYSHE